VIQKIPATLNAFFCDERPNQGASHFRLDESQVSIGQSLEIFSEKKCRKIFPEKSAVIATMLIVDDCQRKIGLLYARLNFS
jgi:hypothetical protein